MASAASRKMRRLSMAVLREMRHRVVTAGVERMAAAEAPRRQPTAFQGTMAADRLDGVAGAGRLEAAARAQERAQGVTVELDEQNQELLHRLITSCQCQSRLVRKPALSRCRAALRACTTRST